MGTGVKSKHHYNQNLTKYPLKKLILYFVLYCLQINETIFLCWLIHDLVIIWLNCLIHAYICVWLCSTSLQSMTKKECLLGCMRRLFVAIDPPFSESQAATFTFALLLPTSCVYEENYYCTCPLHYFLH